MELHEITPLRNSQEFSAIAVTWFNGFRTKHVMISKAMVSWSEVSEKCQKSPLRKSCNVGLRCEKSAGFLRSSDARCLPRGPKDWKNSRFRSGIETFKRPISDWKFQSRLKISSEIENKAPFMGNYQGRDWYFQARLEISIEIEICNPGLKTSSVWIENFTRSIGIEFFQSQGPLGRFGLPLRLGLRCERPQCQIASDVGSSDANH